MKIRKHGLSVLVLFASVAFSTLAVAQDESGENQPDPPARAARLQYMSGSVSVQPHGTDDWVAGVLNRPLTNSDNVWADKNSRAEISVGTGLIRIDSETSLTLTNVSENSVQLQLHQGAMNLHVRRLYDNETYEVDTPNQVFTVLKPGDYRFDVDSEGDKTVVTVWRGEGEASGSGPAVRIRADQQAKFSNGDSMTSEMHGAPNLDDFDEWARNRDERLDHSESARYVSPDVVGYEDLDEYGSWHNTPDYGAIWVPSGVAVGWAPYRYGHWIWVAPWGWTWVEDEPWGYAPFHYGRWLYLGGYWGWAPGPIYVRPYYAPALVAWFGGPSWGVSVGLGGGYGWCPLGWGEPFVPWYRVSRSYFSSVNITNTHFTRVTNITNIYNNTYIHNYSAHPVGGYGGNGLHYANLRAPNGFTAVPRNTLLNSESVARSAMRISPNQLSRMSPVRTLDVRPNRNSMLSANSGRAAVVPPSGSFARPTMGRVGMSPAAHGISENGVMRAGRGENMANPGRGTMNRAAAGGQQAYASRVIPRPPRGPAMQNGAGMRVGSGDYGRAYTGRGAMPGNGGALRSDAPQARPQSVPRPPSLGTAMRSIPARTYNQRAGGINVPRPPSANISRPYSAAAQRQSYGGWNSSRQTPSYQASNRPSPYWGGSYGRPMPSYGGSYTRSTPSYGAGSYTRSAPNYGGAPYERSAPNYDRGSVGRSMPTYRGGGYGSSAPSYGGSRPESSGRSYGGGHSYGGPSGGGASRGNGGGGHSGRH